MKGGSKGIPFKNPVSYQTEKLMAATKFSDYLGLKHYKKAKKSKKSSILIWLIGLKVLVHTIVYHLQGIQTTN